MGEQLLITRMLERGAGLFPDSRVITVAEGGVRERSFAAVVDRVARLAGLLRERRVGPGDTVASLAFNTDLHLELYFAVPALGAILHTVNLRLAAEQAARVRAEGGAAILFCDPSVADLAREIGAADPVPLDSSHSAAVAAATPIAAWPALDEEQGAMLCHTSGTSGAPRGVLYTHRGSCLHAAMLCHGQVYGFTEEDVAMPVVPMFHAGAWGIPYAAWQSGADLVLPAEAAGDPARLLDLIEAHGVTFLAAVPTVWLRLVEEQEARPRDLSSLRALVSGGAALPASLAARAIEVFGVELWHGWGMTETGPLASLSKVPAALRSAPVAERAEVLAGQGRPVPGCRLRLRDLETGEVRDLTPGARGELLARAGWTATSYLDGEPAPERFEDGWVRSGDIARVDERGGLRIVDRLKDLVKSGGEWISSLELEAALCACDGVREAAVVAAASEEWGERPVAFLVVEGDDVDLERVRAQLTEQVPRWWLPDQLIVLEELPKTSVGKHDKRALRTRLYKA